MKKTTSSFEPTARYRLALLSIATTLAASVATAQDIEQEEVIVTGIRAAQASAVNAKRDAVSIVDAISAEDIGKLPDVTISDSLQRITGVQIRRTAGEGASLNVRGMAQVLTTLNGESYLGASSLTDVLPNFSDVPSQLFNGATLAKSQTASQHPGGVTGVVDLSTYRPFSFDDGVTVSGALLGSTGRDSGENDPSINGLINWKNDRFGVLFSLSHAEANLANYYSGIAGGGDYASWSGFAGENWSWGGAAADSPFFGSALVDGGADFNGDGDTDDTYWAPVGHVAYNRFAERERNGFNVSFQADLGQGFELIAEGLYTKMDEHDRIMGVGHSDKWQRWGWFIPTEYANKDVEANGRSLVTVQSYTGNGRRFKSYSSVKATESESTNVNLELNYDNGGPFTGSLRVIHGDASQEQLNSYMDIDLANGSQWGVGVQNYPGGPAPTNPNGYAGYPVLTVDYSGSDPHWRGFDNNANLDIDGNPIAGVEARSLGSYIADVNSYSLGALSSENNYLREADLSVIRADGAFVFEDSNFLTSLDFGVRMSSRSVENDEFDLLSPMGPNACGVRWKATDVTLNDPSCNWEDPDNPGVYYTAGAPTPISGLGAVQVSDFGGAQGIPAAWVVDPSTMDDVEAYQENLYPGTYRGRNAGRSYKVELDELSYFLQANFATGIMSGNFGVRAVATDLSVIQNEVQSGNPYGAAGSDIGDIKTDQSLYELLPALNLSFDLAEDLKLRGGLAKTSAPLNLQQWGGALSINYVLDSEEGSPTEGQFIVNSANSDGNPNLKPWSATNFDISLEKYIGESSMLSAAWFYIDIESFVIGGSITAELPDQDGVVRRTTDVTTSLQGEGGVLEGIELSAKLAFSDFFGEGIWSGFGAEVNFTHSPSDSGFTDLSGDGLPFTDNSEEQYNLIGWYEAGRWQARIAYNYRSDRLAGINQTWGEGALWQAATEFVDASATYDVNDNMSLFINVSNLLGEKEEYYVEYSDQFAWQFEYEPRYSLGIRATF